MGVAATLGGATVRTFARISWLVVFLVAIAQPASATDYYVGVSGSDTNPGSLAEPFRTVARGVLALAAGDTLVVGPGAYPESIVLTRAGEPLAPITVRALPGAILVSPDPDGSRSAIDIYAAAAHLVVEGFEISGGFAESVFVRAGANNIELGHLDIHHNRAGIWIGGASNVLVRDSIVHHNARSGIRIFAGASHVQLRDVRTEYQDDGAGCAGDADGVSVDASVSGLELVRVHASSNSEDGLDVAAPSVQMHEVEAHGNLCSGIKLGGGGALHNVFVTGSRIGVTVSGNATTTTVMNATLLDNGIGIRALGTTNQVAVQNSIVSGVGKALQLNGDVALREHHNIFYRPDADSRLIVRTVSGGELLYSAADVNEGRWQIASGGQGAATIAVDPELDSAGRPRGPRGPAIESGDADGSPAIDLDGAARPTGRHVDRGAFEYQPEPATVSVARAVVRSRNGGSGELRISMTMILPASLPIDISHENINLAVRGSDGTVMAAVVDDASRIGRTVGTYRRRVRFRRVGNERIKMILRQSGEVVRISLRAAGVNVGAMQTDELWIDVVAGDVAAHGYARLRNNGGSFSLP